VKIWGGGSLKTRLSCIIFSDFALNSRIFARLTVKTLVILIYENQQSPLFTIFNTLAWGY
jgi:hypothetical protein